MNKLPLKPTKTLKDNLPSRNFPNENVCMNVWIFTNYHSVFRMIFWHVLEKSDQLIMIKNKIDFYNQADN